MNYASVVRVLSFMMLFLAGGTLLPVVVAVYAGEPRQVFSLLATGLGIAVLASSILLLTPKPRRKSRPSDALGVVILWWFTAPVAAALPFVLGVADNSVLHAIHEATACLTTTGQSVIELGDDPWPASLVVWRGVLHILGGLATIVTAASVLAALNLGGPGIHRTILFTLPETSFFDAVPRVTRWVAIMMAVCILGLIAALILAGVPFPRAVEDAISAITTGLVAPDSATRPALPIVGSIVLAIGLIVGALGLAVWLPLRDRRIKAALTDPETVMFMLLILVFAAVILPLGLGMRDSISWSLTALATSGIALTDTPVRDIIPLPIFVLPSLIGGSALSAAGGVKIARLIVLARRAGQEFRQLGYRRSVLGFQFRDRELDERSVIGVWVYLIAYIVAVFAVMIGFSFLNLPFESTIRLAIGGLTNSGALLIGHTDQLGDGPTSLLIFSMLLGRLEILALFPALAPSFWRG
ncbi:potassium transporter TrkG [Hyphomonas johnsonii]|uniref:Putative potassium uptake protein TrkH n=1 Tax=Hyphomonas johnsonii MHS-2 TaxID=1280950 RepID=A0A059FVY2_9PROT|nr:potassium transporter TrkG [Hyphomonas johnsonii]KCZ94646.1 putative potassium uptake protein TrkH [Hyphomonas johnsonii MHS-2]